MIRHNKEAQNECKSMAPAYGIYEASIITSSNYLCACGVRNLCEKMEANVVFRTLDFKVWVSCLGIQNNLK